MIDLSKILEQTSLPRILEYLLEKHKASRTDLKNNIEASQQAIYNALPLLKNNGLVKETKGKDFPYKVEIELTEKGRKIAEHISEISKLVNS